jgi:hypothetical protein
MMLTLGRPEVRRQIFALVVAVALSGLAAAQTQESEAARIVADYLKMPYPEGDRLDEGRSQRLDMLSRLKAAPDEAADAIGRALPQVKDPRRRVDLAEALGRHIQTKKSATLLCELLKDPDEKVRWQAIQSLGLLASFERITGKSFGRIPMNPLICSDSRQIPKLEKGYHDLLATWAQWWAWEPPGNP